jgi:hypothetical protein
MTCGAAFPCRSDPGTGPHRHRRFIRTLSPARTGEHPPSRDTFRTSPRPARPPGPIFRLLSRRFPAVTRAPAFLHTFTIRIIERNTMSAPRKTARIAAAAALAVSTTFAGLATATATEPTDPPVTSTPTETGTPAPEPTETGTPAPEPTETGTPAPEPTETGTPAPEPTETGTPSPEPEYTAPAESLFPDVATDNMYYREISWLAEKKISTGWTEEDGTKTFRPYQAINRDAIAAFLYRLAGSPEYTAPEVSPFTDVTVENMYYKEIAWLAEQGISTGWLEADETKTFRPYEPVDRDAMAAFLYRLAGGPEHTAPEASPFADVAADVQFYTEMSWLAEKEISTGWAEDDGTKTYRPWSPVNRDAMATFLYRFDTKGLLPAPAAPAAP